MPGWLDVKVSFPAICVVLRIARVILELVIRVLSVYIPPSNTMRYPISAMKASKSPSVPTSVVSACHSLGP